ncbi:MAG: ribosome biogenesis GTP-binding protein YihA/YsxC [candidate division Zixibacteria bacterium]|nr:ribosome biogenesis GTP-binding protein YihA/YsxC [candidate division Zixibacteria bacterium]
MGARGFNAEFVGSFFDMQQIPVDRRPHVALAGRSNVGKSSLLNRLVGRRGLAKVSGTPGKTRSLNFFLVNGAFYLVDLPGYGYARVAKEIKESWGRMIETYLRTSTALAGLILLIDSRREPTPEDVQLLDWLAAREVPALIALTKADKLTRSQLGRQEAHLERDLGLSAIVTSVKTGVGKLELQRAITELVEDFTVR